MKSGRDKKKSILVELPLIVEDQGLGLMIESIKREHLVREGVIRSFARKTNTA